MLYDMCAMAIVAGRPIWTGRMKLVSTSTADVHGRSRRRTRNVHPQTLRQYDRLGLVVPQRTDGGARRYSLRDISRLAKAQQLSQEEGINLLASRGSFPWKRRTASCAASRAIARPAGSSVFAADADGDIVEIERSRRARMWRRQIQVDARQLPSRESVEAARVAADAYDTRGGGVAGENEGIERGKPVSQPISRSIVLWGID